MFPEICATIPQSSKGATSGHGLKIGAFEQVLSDPVAHGEGTRSQGEYLPMDSRSIVAIVNMYSSSGIDGIPSSLLEKPRLHSDQAIHFRCRRHRS